MSEPDDYKVREVNGLELDKKFLEKLKNTCGAVNCVPVFVSDIVLDPGLRLSCEMNYCGEYGRTWVCPPHCGTIEECIERVRQYRQAAVIQTIGLLEDSYDFEGMEAAAKDFDAVFLKAVQFVKERQACESPAKAALSKEGPEFLFLSAGGCHCCAECSVSAGEPCRRPGEAFASLESHGILVSDLAQKAGLNYINGPNTVTYFGAIFMR